MVEEFAKINREMDRTGNFTMDRKKLFQLVGKANSNLADVILKVGLFERLGANDYSLITGGCYLSPHCQSLDSLYHANLLSIFKNL